MQFHLQRLQLSLGIYNSDIEPEHESSMYCSCPIHQYKNRKMARLGVQNQWSKAVMYPGQPDLFNPSKSKYCEVGADEV